jgi:hypothetical protein
MRFVLTMKTRCLTAMMVWMYLPLQLQAQANQQIDFIVIAKNHFRIEQMDAVFSGD